MRYPLASQQSLENFYVSIQFNNPAMARLISDDIRTIALYGLGGDRVTAYPAVIRVRERVDTLSPIFGKVLDNALEALGYSLLDIERYRHTELA